jgi:hypothetical protein
MPRVPHQKSRSISENLMAEPCIFLLFPGHEHFADQPEAPAGCSLASASGWCGAWPPRAYPVRNSGFRENSGIRPARHFLPPARPALDTHGITPPEQRPDKRGSGWYPDRNHSPPIRASPEKSVHAEAARVYSSKSFGFGSPLPRVEHWCSARHALRRQVPSPTPLPSTGERGFPDELSPCQGAQTPIWQLPLWQSRLSWHLRPLAQGGHIGPPQSTSVSDPS